MPERGHHFRFECPECSAESHPGASLVAAFLEGRGQQVNHECPDGHINSLHDCALEAKCRPTFYELFYPLGAIEEGEVSTHVGEWLTVPLSKPFKRVRKVSALCTPLAADECLSIQVRPFIHINPKLPDAFWLGVCGPGDADRRVPVTVTWTAYGDIAREESELWRESLIWAAMELLGHNFRAATLQSAVAVETFSSEYLAQAVRGEHGRVDRSWDEDTVRTYLTGSPPTGLSVKGRLRVGFHEILRIPLLGTDHWGNWKKLHDMRNALAHGKLAEYRQVRRPSGQPFRDDEDRAGFAYETAVRMIYYIRYFREEP